MLSIKISSLKNKNPWLLFAPFLLIYLLIIYFKFDNKLTGDEPRYLLFAQNLLHGFYSPKEELNLWNGPGYPLFIAPFLKLGFPMIGLKLLNGFLQYASIIFLYKTLLQWVSFNKAIFLSLFWACYYIAYKEMTLLYTEPLSSLLVCLILYFTTKAYQEDATNLKQRLIAVIIPGILLGYLILTKIIFGYVVIALFVLYALMILTNAFVAKKVVITKGFSIALIALIINIPYLFYTYQLSHKMFYWGNSGGMSLYWASTPFEHEYGDWNDDHFRAYCDYDTSMPCNDYLFAQNHAADYQQIYQFKGVQRDDAFKAKAIENIKSHPLKYGQNTITNISRLFFNYPTSYGHVQTKLIWRILPNILVLGILIFSIFTSASNFKKHPPLLVFCIALLLFYLCSSILVSAFQRQLYVVLPIILCWFAWLRDTPLINNPLKNQEK